MRPNGDESACPASTMYLTTEGRSELRREQLGPLVRADHLRDAGAARHDRSSGRSAIRGSDRGGLDGLLDLARLQTTRAHISTSRLALQHDPDALEVRIETPLGRDHRMAPVIAETGLLPADCADPGHRVGMVAEVTASAYFACACAVERSCWKRSAISSAVRAAAAPRSTRAAACSGVSTVRTPNATGTPVSSADSSS